MIKPLRKADILLFFILLACAALLAALPLVRATSSSGQTVKVISGGEVVGMYPLEIDIEAEISRDGHLNIVSIKDGKVHMEYSDCKNQICVNTGVISETGDIIVCLPNYVIVEIIDNE